MKRLVDYILSFLFEERGKLIVGILLVATLAASGLVVRQKYADRQGAHHPNQLVRMVSASILFGSVPVINCSASVEEYWPAASRKGYWYVLMDECVPVEAGRIERNIRSKLASK